MTVRPATPADVRAVLALWGTSRTEHAVTEDTPEAVGRVVAAGHLLVAEDRGAIVGALIAGFDGWRGNMYRLAVAEPHRRRGIATALVEAAHERLRALGCVRVTALVAEEDARAIALWTAAGYARDPIMSRFVRNLPSPTVEWPVRPRYAAQLATRCDQGVAVTGAGSSSAAAATLRTTLDSARA